MKLTTWGAAQTVTGSKHLITTDSNKKILLDCGLFQGKSDNINELNNFWGFNPSEIDYIIVSHAHIDHTGLLPKLVKDGFNGAIYATEATIDLCEVMLLDSAKIQESDLKYLNKRREKKQLKPIEPLYNEDDAIKTISLFKTIPLNQKFSIDDEVNVETRETGHIIGSVYITLRIKNKENQIVTVTFTGDIGRKADAILKGPSSIPVSEYIICESTYGNRIHQTTKDLEETLLKIVHETCVEKKGKIIIPAFSVDRTQEIIYALDQLAHENKLPKISVYVDSPLSIKATEIMNKHRHYFNQEIMDYITKDGDPFSFPQLKYVQSADESKKINDSKEPCIIISASGMAEAGRVKHHIKNNIEKENTTILLVGYASPETLAGKLKAGERNVRIFGEEFEVLAKIEVLESFSAHADYLEITDLLLPHKNYLKNLILVHGELETQMDFKTFLIEKGFKNITIPKKGQTIELN